MGYGEDVGLTDDLVEELREAIRSGLRAAGIKGMLAAASGQILSSIVPVLTRRRYSTEEIADAMEGDGGFVRIGSACGLVDGRFVTPGALVDALLLRIREPKELPRSAPVYVGRALHNVTAGGHLAVGNPASKQTFECTAGADILANEDVGADTTTGKVLPVVRMAEAWQYKDELRPGSAQ